ncbi:MAG: hypothetical protein KAG66_24550 [Methylococcales bacterium]|nr:hypothetical protein [Methylococcales bacterium]
MSKEQYVIFSENKGFWREGEGWVRLPQHADRVAQGNLPSELLANLKKEDPGVSLVLVQNVQAMQKEALATRLAKTVADWQSTSDVEGFMRNELGVSCLWSGVPPYAWMIGGRKLTPMQLSSRIASGLIGKEDNALAELYEDFMDGVEVSVGQDGDFFVVYANDNPKSPCQLYLTEEGRLFRPKGVAEKGELAPLKMALVKELTEKHPEACQLLVKLAQAIDLEIRNNLGAESGPAFRLHKIGQTVRESLDVIRYENWTPGEFDHRVGVLGELIQSLEDNGVMFKSVNAESEIRRTPESTPSP